MKACLDRMLRHDIVATTPMALRWNARFATNGMCAKKNTIYAWREQAIIE